MLRDHRHRTWIIAVLVATGCAVSLSCTTDEGESSPVGRYALRAALDGEVEHSLPYMADEGTPGDSTAYYGATLIIRSDSTFLVHWEKAHCHGGLCQPQRSDTFDGTWYAGPAPAGYDFALGFHFSLQPPLGGDVGGLFRGSRLEWDHWLFHRAD